MASTIHNIERTYESFNRINSFFSTIFQFKELANNFCLPLFYDLACSLNFVHRNSCTRLYETFKVGY